MRSLQERIDEQKYPPTHTYELDCFRPTGVLDERVKILSWIGTPRGFFNGRYFLDVGCNKGWFSFNARKSFKYTLGIDTNTDNTDLCNDIREFIGKERGIEFKNISFRDFEPNYRFDRVFMGNVHHHIHKDAGGWEWVAKLAALTEDKGLVMIEGPAEECPDLNGFFDPDVDTEFTNLEGRMLEHNFVLMSVVPSVKYTPGRYVWLFRKTPMRISTWTGTSNEIEKFSFHPWDQTRIELASYAPYSNRISSWVWRGQSLAGWGEERIKDLDTFVYKTNEKELFNAHCERNVFLARNGYIDLDGATINFGLSDGKLVHFDKGCVYHINTLDEKWYDYYNGYYFVLMRQSYNTVPERIYKGISEALRSKDSREIERCFIEARI